MPALPECDCCGRPSRHLGRYTVSGIETYACPSCAGFPEPEDDEDESEDADGHHAGTTPTAD